MTITRRAALIGLAAGLATPATAAKRRFDWPLGVQLWSVDAELRKDFDGTLHRLASLGYVRVESAGLHGRTPTDFRRGVEGAGLRCDSAHVSMTDLYGDAARRIGEARDQGAAWLVCSSPMPLRRIPTNVPWITAITEAMTLDAWLRGADILNEVAARARTVGLNFAYHNHPGEFGLYDGKRGFDVLMAQTDRRLVQFELDAAWAVAGGQDPVKLLRTHRDRFRLLHLKDVKVAPPAGQMATDFTTVEVGRGVIDWRRLLAAAHSAGVVGAYVEVEPPFARPVWESLVIARDYLATLR